MSEPLLPVSQIRHSESTEKGLPASLTHKWPAASSRAPLDEIKRQNSAQSVAALRRRQFTIEEINKIFDAENFLPWAKGRPDHYWGVLLAAGTGARANEVCQLYAGNVARDTAESLFKIKLVRHEQGDHLAAPTPDAQCSPTPTT